MPVKDSTASSRMEVLQYDQRATSWLSNRLPSPQEQCHSGVDFYSWQVEHSAVVWAKLALMAKNPCGCVHTWPCPHGHYLLAHWTWAKMTEERGRLMMSEWIILATWLLKSFSTMAVWWWVFIHNICSHVWLCRWFYPYVSYQTLPPIFQSCPF